MQKQGGVRLAARLFSIFYLNCKFGLEGMPQTTFSINNSLQGIPEFTKVIVFMVTVYYRGRNKSRLGKGKRCTGQSLGRFNTSSMAPPLFICDHMPFIHAVWKPRSA